MKARIIVRLVMHVLVLAAIVGFFVMFPAMLRGLLGTLGRFDTLIKVCSGRLRDCLGFIGYWAVVIAPIAALILDVDMLRRGRGVERVLRGSLAWELLLPASWYAAARATGGDVIGPAFLLVPGPAIMLSAVASAVVAWLLVRDGLKSALSAAWSWVEGAIAVVLTLIGGALTYLFADLLLSQF